MLPLIVVTLLLCSCISGESGPAATHPGPDASLPVKTPGQLTAMPGWVEPFEYTMLAKSTGESYVEYPSIMWSGESGWTYDQVRAIDNALLERALKHVSGLSHYVRGQCSVKMNEKGIWSIYMMDIREFGGADVVGAFTFTLDVQKGKVCTIADLFEDEEDRWRRVLPELVTIQAEKMGLTLFADLMPISDEQMFYIRGDSIVLVYNPYEIATNSFGECPEFFIPVKQLEEFIPAHSLLSRLLS